MVIPTTAVHDNDYPPPAPRRGTPLLCRPSCLLPRRCWYVTHRTGCRFPLARQGKYFPDLGRVLCPGWDLCSADPAQRLLTERLLTERLLTAGFLGTLDGLDSHLPKMLRIYSRICRTRIETDSGAWMLCFCNHRVIRKRTHHTHLSNDIPRLIYFSTTRRFANDVER